MIDLRDELKQKQEIVQVSSPLLKEAQAIDLKTREIKDILVKQSNFQQMLSYFLSVFPSKMRGNVHGHKRKGMEFEGISEDSAIIKIFLDKLKADKAFKTIDLGSIRREEIASAHHLSSTIFYQKIDEMDKESLIKQFT